VANERCVGTLEDGEKYKQTGKATESAWKTRVESKTRCIECTTKNGNTPIRGFEDGKIAKKSIRR
jgi:hypothetical protein